MFIIITMTNRYVIDTNCLINYFHSLFNEEDKLSNITRSIITRAFNKSGDVILIIPSIVLIEIYYKWFKSEEFARKFYYEVYIQITNSPYIEIKPIEKEVLENLLVINIKHDIHDKIILASALMLECPIITYDRVIIKYVSKTGKIPATIS